MSAPEQCPTCLQLIDAYDEAVSVLLERKEPQAADQVKTRIVEIRQTLGRHLAQDHHLIRRNG